MGGRVADLLAFIITIASYKCLRPTYQPIYKLTLGRLAYLQFAWASGWNKNIICIPNFILVYK